jgi:hypothetical protein
LCTIKAADNQRCPCCWSVIGSVCSQFLGASQTDEQTLMILEYMENGDLFSALRKDPAGELLWYRK